MPEVDGLATTRMVRDILDSDRPPEALLATSYSLEELDNTPGSSKWPKLSRRSQHGIAPHAK